MEVNFKFKLPEEKEDYETFSKAYDYKSALWEMEQYLRNNVKYPKDSTTDEELETFQKVRNEFYNILQQRNLNLD